MWEGSHRLARPSLTSVVGSAQDEPEGQSSVFIVFFSGDRSKAEIDKIANACAPALSDFRPHPVLSVNCLYQLP